MDIIASIACGFLSGLGIGGGSLLTVWMTAVLSLQQQNAQTVNLLYFLPTAAVSLIFHSKNRFVDWKASLWTILGGVCLAVAGAFLSTCLSTALLRKLFGGFLLFVGASELFTKQNGRSKNAPS